MSNNPPKKQGRPRKPFDAKVMELIHNRRWQLDSYREIAEYMKRHGYDVSHETIRKMLIENPPYPRVIEDDEGETEVPEPDEDE